jgi:hypothetical protein
MASARARSADSSSLESRNDAVTQFNGSDKSAGAPLKTDLQTRRAFKHAARSKTPQHAYRIHISLHIPMASLAFERARLARLALLRCGVRYEPVGASCDWPSRALSSCRLPCRVL